MNSPMTSYFTRASRFAARRLACRWLPLNKQKGVVSFTFDDVPASACHAGADILEAADARGSFYVCGQLTGGLEQGQLCHSTNDLQSLQARGHEIGCHTYSHTNCSNANLAQLRADWDKNQAFFAQYGVPNEGFAFPFGAYDLGSKLAASRRFAYSRITGGGTQLQRADLHALRAQALYAQSFDREHIASLIQQTAEQGGWLILYTHEVIENPGPWGAAPELLSSVLQMTRQAGCAVLPVRDAIRFFRS